MVTLAQLEEKRERLLADYYALQGAIQVLDDLIALSKQGQPAALTLDQFAEALGGKSAEIIPAGGDDEKINPVCNH